MNNEYRQVSKHLLGFIAVIFVLNISTFLAFLLIPFLLFSLADNKHPERLLIVLLCIPAITMVNDVFFQKDTSFFLATRISLLFFALLLFMQGSGEKDRTYLFPLHMLVGYIIYMMCVSLQGWMPIISELKALLFLTFILAFLGAIKICAKGQLDTEKLRFFMLAICVFYIIGSLAVYPFPSIGRSMVQRLSYGDEARMQQIIENVGLYNGMTFHSQALGPVIASLNAFVFSDYLFNRSRKNRLYITLLCAAPVVVFLTASRTAFAGWLVSILATIYVYYKAKGVSAHKKGKAVGTVVGLSLLACIILVLSQGGMGRVQKFLLKFQATEDIRSSDITVAALFSSRQGMIDDGLENFRESPLIGNGFQVAKGMRDLKVDDFRQLLSAPIEKGVVWTMVLEEGGVIGAFIFLGFLISLYFIMMKEECYSFVICFTTMLMLNTGEATFFSISSTGGLSWMTCFVGLFFDLERRKHRRQGYGEPFIRVSAQRGHA